mmetsp:Transcript_8631/g.35504  ORF Transcript_8631/g.35504 Transcript_8631/m.35504 type:complete len:341 (-) Transcript_8631:98-1120(-)
MRIVAFSPVWARLRRGQRTPPLTRRAALCVLCVAVGFAVDVLLFYTGARLVPLGVAFTIFSVAPALSVIIGAATRCATPRPGVLLSTFLCVAGVVVAYQPWRSSSGHDASLAGYLMCLAVAGTEAMIPFGFEELTRLGWRWYDQAQAVAVTTALIVNPAIAFVAWLAWPAVLEIPETRRLYRDHTFDVVGSAASMALGGVFLCVSYAVATDVVLTSLAGYSEIPLGFLIQVLILGQPTNLHQVLGGALVLAGVVALVLLDDHDATKRRDHDDASSPSSSSKTPHGGVLLTTVHDEAATPGEEEGDSGGLEAGVSEQSPLLLHGEAQDRRQSTLTSPGVRR